jgi:hypothetical protein
MVPAKFLFGYETESVGVRDLCECGYGKPLTRGEREAAASTLLTRCPEYSANW